MMKRSTTQLPTENFRARLTAGTLLMGTFIKLPAPQSVEIVGAAGFDFVVIDAEHAPFHRGTIDHAILAARAVGLAALVRVADDAPSNMLAALDCGAHGVLVPHVDSVEKARAVASACRYRGGSRGFTAAGRAAGYGDLRAWEHVDAQDRSVAVIAMIEDPDGVKNIEAIAAIDGIHGFFIGRGDLSIVTGAESAGAPEVIAATQRVCDAVRAAGKPVCIMADGLEEARRFRAMGANAFLIDSDQGFLRRAASSALAALAPLYESGIA